MENNKLDAAITLIENAKEMINSQTDYWEISWQAYRENLKVARRLLLEMYPEDSDGLECHKDIVDKLGNDKLKQDYKERYDC